jgi:hypothetical protein
MVVIGLLGVGVLGGCGSSGGSAKAVPKDLAELRTALADIDITCPAPHKYDPKKDDQFPMGEPPTQVMECKYGKDKVQAAQWKTKADLDKQVDQLVELVCAFDEDSLNFVTNEGWLVSANQSTNVDVKGKKTSNRAEVLATNKKIAEAAGTDVVDRKCPKKKKK